MSFLFKKRRPRGATDADDQHQLSSTATSSPSSSPPTTPTSATSSHSSSFEHTDQNQEIRKQNSQLQQLLAKKKFSEKNASFSSSPSSPIPSPSTSSSNHNKNNNNNNDDDDAFSKMYEEMYMKQVISSVDDDPYSAIHQQSLDVQEIDSRNQKFISFKNPLYEGTAAHVVSQESITIINPTSITHMNTKNENQVEEDQDYADEPDEEELYWQRQKEMEEMRGKSRKLRKMNVLDVVHVPIQLSVQSGKFLSYPVDEQQLKNENLVHSGKKVCEVMESWLSDNESFADMVQECTKESVLAASTESIIADELFETVAYSLDEVMVWHIQGMNPVLLEQEADGGDWEWGCLRSNDCYIVLKTFNAQNEDERLRVAYTWMGENADWQKRAVCAFLVQELIGKLTTGMKRLRMEKQFEESAEFRDLFNGHLKYEKKEEINNDNNDGDNNAPEATIPTIPDAQPCVNRPPVAGSSPTLLVFSLSFDAEEGDKKEQQNRKVNANRFKIVVTRVPWNNRYARDSISSPDELMKKSAFIVNSSDKIHVWLGSECLQPLQIKMIETAKLIMYEEHKKDGIIVIETQGSESQEFLDLLPCDKEQKLVKYSPEMINLDTVVYQVGLNESTKLIDVTLMSDFVLHANRFENHYCYLIETQYDVYGWMGRDTLPMERRFLKRLLNEVKEKNEHVLTCTFFYGYEPVLLRERFSGYTVTDTRETYEARRKELSNISRMRLTTDTQSYFDTYNQLDIEAERQRKLIDELDDGSGTVQVWRVIDFDIAEPVPEASIGNFHTGECYLILYEFNRADVLYGAHDDDDEEDGDEESEESEDEYKDYDYESQSDGDEDEDERGLVKKSSDVKKKRIAYLTRKILYCWEGAESDKKVAARILKENFHGYASDAINPAIVLTQYEGKESKHFMRVFEYIMTIHRGKSTDKRESYDSALYRIYCKTDPVDGTSYNSKAVEVLRRKGSLNSNDIFVLVSTKTAYIWVGCYAGIENKKIAFKLAQSIITGNKRVLAIDEDQEPEDFWEDLGQVSVNDKYPEDKINYERGNVFECTITSNNNFRVMDIGNVGDNILQHDLTDCHYPLIFDFSDTMFIWYPQSNPDPTIRYLVRNAVYELTIPDSEQEEDEGSDSQPLPKPDFHELCVAGNDKVKVCEEYRGEESAEFKMVFPMWRTNRIFVDRHAVEKQSAEEERSATIVQALPFLDILRQKHPYLLQEDEYVNIHNAVELVKIGLGAKTNSDIVIKELCSIELYDYNNDLDKCDELCTDLMRFCLTGIKKRKPTLKK